MTFFVFVESDTDFHTGYFIVVDFLKQPYCYVSASCDHQMELFN